MWDQRYSPDHFVYGTAPNDFLAESIEKLPTGRVLCLAEGEGRNAVFLAARGDRVTAVDASAVGLAKAQRLAAERSVDIETLTCDLAELEIEPDSWDLIVSIFAHVPAALRADLHRRVAAGLRPGGFFLLEAYTPDQLRYATGGPPTAELMMTLEALRGELAGLDLIYALERVRPVHEGELHFGDGAVVQVIARRPTVD